MQSNKAKLIACSQPHGSIAAMEELGLTRAASKEFLKWFHEDCAPDQGYPVQKAQSKALNSRGARRTACTGEGRVLRSSRLDQRQRLMLTTSSTKNLHQDSCLECQGRSRGRCS